MDHETYIPLPLSIDPVTKAVSSSDPSLQHDLDELNKLHRALLQLETPNQIPPPPMAVNPKRTAQVDKMKDTGNAAYKKGQVADGMWLQTAVQRQINTGLIF
jgi:translocation protein SEC72